MQNAMLARGFSWIFNTPTINTTPDLWAATRELLAYDPIGLQDQGSSFLGDPSS